MIQPRWLRANGIDFAYLECGERAAPLVLCLHGFPDTAWSFVPVLERLAAAGYRAVAPFTRGYAPSSLAADHDYRSTTRGRDIIALIEHLGAQQAYVVGHDWGAVAGYIAVALRPDRIRAFTAAAIPHLGRFLLGLTRRQIVRSRYMGLFQLRGIAERRVTADDFSWLRWLIRSWSPNWNFTEEDFAPLRAAFSDPARLDAALSYYRTLPGEITSAESRPLLFKPVGVPALVIRGRQDGCIGPEMFENQGHRFAAEYRLHTMEDAGHFMQCEKPDEFVRVVVEFFHKHRL